MANKKQSFNCRAVFSLAGVVNEGVDIVEFIKNSNDYSGEPKNADGCIVAMHVQDVEIVPRKNKKGIAANED